MVAYRLDGAPNAATHSLTRPRPDASFGSSSWLTEARLAADAYQHPVAIFDAAGQPLFQNAALSRLLAAVASSFDQESWPQVYSTVCRVAAEAVIGRSAISTVIAVNRRSFAILGSLTRQNSGIVSGAIVHISEVKPAAADRMDFMGLRGAAGSDDQAYQNWVARHTEAVAKMQRLSPRESQVVFRVSEGMPNKTIARELEISVKTIEKHRANAVRKLGVTSTPEMVRIAVLAGTGTVAAESN